jgi:MYXO-CTERM domain-containing protein
MGAYGVLLELTPAGLSTFTKSDPFLIVFNQGLAVEAFESGVDAMVQVTAVPEPSSIALAGLGVAGLAGAALRRRMRKQ